MGNSNLDKLWFVFPPYISCIGRNFPFKVMVKVVVILLLLLKPEMETEFEPFLAISVLPTEIYFLLVWSRFSTNDEGIWNISTLLTISCKSVSSTSFFCSCRNFNFSCHPSTSDKFHAVEQTSGPSTRPKFTW